MTSPMMILVLAGPSEPAPSIIALPMSLKLKFWSATLVLSRYISSAPVSKTRLAGLPLTSVWR